MKYCPNCGNLIDGKFECSCGWKGEENPLPETIGVITTDFKTGMMDPSEFKKENDNQIKNNKERKNQKKKNK